MRALLFCFCGALVFFLYNCSDHSGVVTVIHSSDYVDQGQKDATPAFLNMMRDAKKAGRSRIVIEPGTYHFYPEKAFETFCFITNHDDGLRSTPFPVIGYKGLEIVGEGAEFIFHGLMVPFILEGSEDIRMSGFTIDWELPLHSEVEVIARNESTHAFDVRVDIPYEIRDGELLFLKEGFEHSLERSLCWDPTTGAVAYNCAAICQLQPRRNRSLVRFADQIPYLYEQDPQLTVNRFRGREVSLRAEEISPGIVRLSGHHAALPEVGWVIISKGENSLNRPAPAIRIHGCRDVVITDVTIHHAGGMGVIAERTENVLLERVRIALREGSGRLLTTSADATHFNNCRGLIEMKDCLFENMLDDATNVHGTYVRIADIIDTHTVGIHLGHFQQLGYEFALPGDQCGFVREGISLSPFQTAIVSNVEKINKRYYLLSFKEELHDIKEGDLIDNLDWYPEVKITGCTVRNNRARGFLFSTPHKVLVENNHLSCMMSAILLPAGFAGYWYESGRIQNCTIRNNYFGDSGYGGGSQPIISAHLDESDDPFPYGKLVIENNVFNTFDPYILNISGVDTLVFSNNEVKRSGTYPVIRHGNPVLRIQQINHQVIEENRIEGGLNLFDQE